MQELLERGPRNALATEKKPWISEDWPAVWIGLFIFGLAVAGLYGRDLLGWAVTISVWTDVNKALNTATKSYADIGGPAALGLTYAALLAVLTLAAIALRVSVWRFVLGEGIALIASPRRPLAPREPAVTDAPFLANARFILEKETNFLAWMGLGNLSQALLEPPLKASCAASSFSG